MSLFFFEIGDFWSVFYDEGSLPVESSKIRGGRGGVYSFFALSIF